MFRKLWFVVFNIVIISINGANIVIFCMKMTHDLAGLWSFNYSQLVIQIFFILLSVSLFCWGTIRLWRTILGVIRDWKLRDYEYLKRKFSELHKKLQDTVIDKKEKLNIQIAETDSLIKQKDQLVVSLNTVNETCEKATQDLQQLKQDYNNKLLKTTELEKAAKDFKKLAENELSKLNVLKKAIIEKQKTIENLQLELTTTKSQSILIKASYEQLQMEYEESSKTFAELKKEESEIITKNKPLKADIKKCREIIATEPNPTELQEELTSLQKKCQELKAENFRLLPLVEPLRVEHSGLKESVTTLETQVKESVDQNNEFKRILQQKSTSLSQIQQENVNLKKEAQQLTKQIPKLQQELSLEQAKKQDIEQEITNLEQALQQASKDTVLRERKLGIIRQSLEALKDKDKKTNEIMRRTQELLQLVKTVS